MNTSHTEVLFIEYQGCWLFPLVHSLHWHTHSYTRIISVCVQINRNRWWQLNLRLSLSPLKVDWQVNVAALWLNAELQPGTWSREDEREREKWRHDVWNGGRLIPRFNPAWAEVFILILHTQTGPAAWRHVHAQLYSYFFDLLFITACSLQSLNINE